MWEELQRTVAERSITFAPGFASNREEGARLRKEAAVATSWSPINTTGRARAACLLLINTGCSVVPCWHSGRTTHWTTVQQIAPRICKMACPFSGGRFKSIHKDERDREGDHRRLARIRQDERGKTPRQPSVQITSLLGEDNDDPEDTQTLNLKHLRAAVIVLTNPSVLNKCYFFF